MAASVKVGSFAAATSTGNQSVTGVGFQPKLLKLYAVRLTADGTGAHSVGSYGLASSSTQRACVSWMAEDPPTTMNTASGISDTKVLRLYDAATTPTLESEADFVSFDADGFTINWTDAPASAWIVLYEAYGGSDITNVKVGTWTIANTVASQSITGVGFQPDFLEIVNDRRGTTAADGVQNNQLAWGAAKGSAAGDQVAMFAVDTDAVGTSQVKSGLKSGAVLLGGFSGTSTSTRVEAAISSFDSDGFSLSYSTQAGEDNLAIYCAIKGGRWKVGLETQQTSATTKATTGVGFQPILMAFRGIHNLVASASIRRSAATTMIGAADGTTEGVVISSSDDNSALASADMRLDRAKAIGFVDAATGNVVSLADLSSFDSDGFTLNWTTADATARQFAFVAFAANATATSKPKTLGLISCG